MCVQYVQHSSRKVTTKQISRATPEMTNLIIHSGPAYIPVTIIAICNLKIYITDT